MQKDCFQKLFFSFWHKKSIFDWDNFFMFFCRRRAKSVHIHHNIKQLQIHVRAGFTGKGVSGTTPRTDVWLKYFIKDNILYLKTCTHTQILKISVHVL